MQSGGGGRRGVLWLLLALLFVSQGAIAQDRGCLTTGTPGDCLLDDAGGLLLAQEAQPPPPPPPPPPSPPACTLTSTPSSVLAGGVSQLGWTSTDATKLDLAATNDAGSPVFFGDLPVSNGVRDYAYHVNTNLMVTATGEGGTATCTARVSITEPPPPPPPPAPPTVSITNPADGAIVKSSVSFRATSNRLAEIVLSLNGALRARCVNTTACTTTVNAGAMPKGKAHEFSATATDEAGLTSTKTIKVTRP